VSAAKKADGKQPTYELTGSWAGAWKIFAGVGVLGLAGAGAGYASDPRRFAFSWLFAFVTFLSIGLGATFFVLIQRLTSAGWSVTVRRTAEFFSYGMLVLLPLFVPVVASMTHLFPWLAVEDGHHGEAAPAKAGEHGGSHGALSVLVKDAHAQTKAPEPTAPPAASAVGAPDTAAHAPAAKVPSAAEPTAPAAGTAHGDGHAAPAGAAAATETAPAGHGAAAAAPAGHGAAAPADHGAAGAGSHSGDARGHDAREGAQHKAHAEIHHGVLVKKSPYLNRSFFYIRAFLYFLIWSVLAIRLFGFSTAQDTSKDPKLTLRAQAFAPPATFLFAFSLTFAAFDWIMALEPSWFSTIFGVYYFATGVVSSLAVIILVTLALKNSGPLAGAVTVEHFHDLGKLMFGFLVFWAYIGFSQFMLIWYAALPEETTWYHNRWDFAPWSTVSMLILFGHFVAPFFWLISRNFKRNLGRLQIGAAILLVMHVVDMYWFVMPNYMLGKEGFSVHWMDAACLLAVGGTYAAFVFFRMTKHPLVPVGDPRLQRSLHFQNA